MEWIKLHTSFLKWEWFDKPEMVQLFVYMLLKANREDKQWHGITVKRGQFVTSNISIRRELKLSAQTIRTCIKRLISTNEITYKSTNKYTVITICKYDEYQLKKNQINEHINEQINEQLTNKQRTTNEQLTTTIEYKSNLKEISTSTNIDKSILLDIDTKKSRLAASSSASDEAQASDHIERIDFTKIKNMWNETCTAYARLVLLSDGRKNKIRNRVAEMGGNTKAIEIFQTIFRNLQASAFLKGDNRRGWKASFDWIIENNINWVKVYEGAYNNIGNISSTPQKDYNNKRVNDLWTTA